MNSGGSPVKSSLPPSAPMIELHDYVDSHLGVLAAMWRKRSAPTPNSSKPPEPRIPPAGFTTPASDPTAI